RQTQILPILKGLSQFPDELADRTWYKSFSLSGGSVSDGGSNASLNLSGLTGDFQDASKLYGWFESLDFVNEIESQNQTRTSYTYNGQKRSMVRFSVTLSVQVGSSAQSDTQSASNQGK
ncbi:MAG: hypothetical protein ABEK50_10255, partial [bacterium]